MMMVQRTKTPKRKPRHRALTEIVVEELQITLRLVLVFCFQWIHPICLALEELDDVGIDLKSDYGVFLVVQELKR